MPIGVYERKNAVKENERYGDWITVDKVDTASGQPVRWNCLCVCGSRKAVPSRTLKSGESTSCGCRRLRVQRAAVTKHGLSTTAVYKVWTSMHQRCTNPNSQMWEYYGARGISVDPRWKDVETFIRDMGPRPPRHSIERRDNDGNYSPENCYWASSTQQARNTSRTRMLTYKGETRTVTEWAAITGIHKSTIGARIRSGKTAEDALAVVPKYVKRNR